jgi:hypothetical protein
VSVRNGQDVLQLQLGHGAKAGETIEDENDVEQIQRKLLA